MKELKNFRTDRGLTVSSMANKIGVSKSLYEKVELDVRKPSREFTSKFKKAFPEFDVNIFFTY